MPGSKTYTSNKINELLEMEFLDVVSEMEKRSAKKLTNAFFGEVLKISLSLLASVGIEYLSLKEISTSAKPAVDPTGKLIVEMETIISLILVFILSYVLINLFILVGKWIFSAVFNKRILSSEKAKSYADFHKKIINHIYLGISFENKYNIYVDVASGQPNDINFDLAANYLSQAVHYFRLAKDELSDLIPTQVKRWSYLDRRNAKYLDYIGFPIINIALISGQRSLMRLLGTKDKLLKITDSIVADANVLSIKQGYSNSLIVLFDEIDSYADCFQDFLKRVADLQMLLQSK